MGAIVALFWMTVFGTLVELARKWGLRKYHNMTLTEYYARKARGESVPHL